MGAKIFQTSYRTVQKLSSELDSDNPLRTDQRGW